MKELLKTKNTTYLYEEKHALLFSIHHGIFNLKKAEEGYSNLGEQKIHYKIADVRRLSGSFMKIMPFFEKNYPRLKSNGLIAEAFIVCEDLILNNLIEKLTSLLTKLGIQTKVFKSKEAAYSWILTLQ